MTELQTADAPPRAMPPGLARMKAKIEASRSPAPRDEAQLEMEVETARAALIAVRAAKGSAAAMEAATAAVEAAQAALDAERARLAPIRAAARQAHAERVSAAVIDIADRMRPLLAEAEAIAAEMPQHFEGGAPIRRGELSDAARKALGTLHQHIAAIVAPL